MRKEKNFVIVEVDGKERKFDLNCGQWVSLRGDKHIQGKPTGIRQAVQYLDIELAEHPLLWALRKVWIDSCYHYYLRPYTLELLDKLESLNLGITITNFSNETVAEFTLKHFKEFVKEVKQCGAERYSMTNFYRKYKKLDWYQEHLQGIQITEEEKEFLYNYFIDYPQKHYSRILWHLRNNRVLELREKISRYSCSYVEERYVESIIDCIKCVSNYASNLEMEIPKGELSTVYIQLMETVKLKQMQEKDEEIKTNQMGKGLSFAFGNYVALVPFTAEEFLNEADQQSNCVYRSYTDRVADGSTNIVFIRHKDDLKKSVVTCEVRNGVIWQYLAKHNNSVNNQELLDFKEKYQEHLDNNFCK